MNTIQARVNPRLLMKADRLFTGTLQGRIIEILQNARRAHASGVEIINDGARVKVIDNGQGIADFSTLLDMGGSGWAEHIEKSEDPAGVGLYCLAPRETIVRSNGKRATIGGAGWTGAPVVVEDDPEPVQGTILHFWDEPWMPAMVNSLAVFSGMEVIVDGVVCPKYDFVSQRATHHEELGCRIEVIPFSSLSTWHRDLRRGAYVHFNVLINFHGQVIGLCHHPIGQADLAYLVEMTGEPTGIRLMLPARTQLVQNQASKQLMNALELEGFRYIQRQGHHTLKYEQYLRAKKLGIQLPEATPTFEVGLIGGEQSPEPVEVTLPEGFPLSECYRVSREFAESDDFAEINVHLLGALGIFETPFVPVSINSQYDGYAWANLPTVESTEVKAGDELHADYLWSGRLVCVKELTLTAKTSDGRTFASPVCMAIRTEAACGRPAMGRRRDSRHP
ncbi:MAG: hypothetical protein IPK83_19005 [Planctomycetes bacterium]|nr:hypothetical protein [Planctomycetota bacterium]